jgi:hypothetical protein
MASRALAPAGSGVDIVPVPLPDYPRLRGAAALVSAPVLAAPGTMSGGAARAGG